MDPHARQEPPSRRRSDESPVVAGLAPSGIIGEMWREALRRSGIVAFVRSRDTAGSLYGAPPMPFAYELMVAPADLDAARAILADIAEPIG